MEFDIRHGVTNDGIAFLDKKRDDASYEGIRNKEGYGMQRLNQLKKHIVGTTDKSTYWRPQITSVL